mmetsp:Transcript_38025/g.74733  ORF Transcript_38025/g.74733 Transcript_38025/m.74733 type:complete len:269 (-) Transcript_38025:371-1177(-)
MNHKRAQQESREALAAAPVIREGNHITLTARKKDKHTDRKAGRPNGFSSFPSLASSMNRPTKPCMPFFSCSRAICKTPRSDRETNGGQSTASVGLSPSVRPHRPTRSLSVKKHSSDFPPSQAPAFHFSSIKVKAREAVNDETDECTTNLYLRAAYRQKRENKPDKTRPHSLLKRGIGQILLSDLSILRSFLVLFPSFTGWLLFFSFGSGPFIPVFLPAFSPCLTPPTSLFFRLLFHNSCPPPHLSDVLFSFLFCSGLFNSSTRVRDDI